MSAKGLGRGLSALLGNDTVAGAPSVTKTLRLSEIEPNPNQPRRNFDEDKLQELANSIKVDGLLQPLTVRKTDDGYYQIIAGERRWRAARIAGISEVTAIVIEADDRRVMELALIENLQREDLNPVEEAEGYARLANDYALTQEEISAKVGRSRSAVANALRLLALPQVIREKVVTGELSAGHARTLLPLEKEELILKAADICMHNAMSVRSLEKLVRSMLEGTKKKDFVNYFEDVERRLSSSMGRKITFHAGRKKGKVEIEYYDSDDLETLINMLENAQKDG